jgi:hypothetical protein
MSYNQYPQYPYYSPQTQAQGDPNQGYYAPQTSWTQGWLAFNDPGYVKGLILGAGLTYLLTNPKVQKAVVKGAVTLWTSIQGGMEEVKEQIQDIKAEMSMKADDAEK